MSIYLYNEVYTIQAPCKSRMGLGLMDWYDGATNEFSSIQDIVPDMTGKIIVITGANSGIGLVTTLQLAHKMAHIYMLCRSESKALTEIEKIILQTSNRNIHFIQCDLSDWPSIIAASMKLKSLINHIDVLINNAGILGVPIFTECNQGVELHMSSNHFGHYILTRELLPLIVNSKSSRIVNVSSNVHASAKVSKSYFSARQAFNYDILKKESYFSYASYCHVN